MGGGDILIFMEHLLTATVYQFVGEWQTLIGALIALVAALWTIKVMRDESATENDRHRVQLRRKELAARAQIPDALAGICDYTEAVGLYLLQSNGDLPPAPIEAVATLKLVVEHIDEGAAQRTFELLSKYQVQRSRLDGGRNGLRRMADADLGYDIVLLRAYTNSLFDYGRNEAETVSTGRLSREEMLNAYRNVFHYSFETTRTEFMGALTSAIERRHPEQNAD